MRRREWWRETENDEILFRLLISFCLKYIFFHQRIFFSLKYFKYIQQVSLSLLFNLHSLSHYSLCLLLSHLHFQHLLFNSNQKYIILNIFLRIFSKRKIELGRGLCKTKDVSCAKKNKKSHQIQNIFKDSLPWMMSQVS